MNNLFSKFGLVKPKKSPAMYEIPNWPNYEIDWAHHNRDILLSDAATEEPSDVTLEKILENSENFPVEFPIQTIRCKTLINAIPKETLEKYINSSYPVLHEQVLILYCNFLDHKRKFGHPPEQELYTHLSLLQFVQRLLTIRAVIFVNVYDHYRLLDGTNGFLTWETIGTEAEGEKLNLRKCLSYDEIKLAALLSISSYTNFINDGSRRNKGVTKRSNVEPEGIIIGLIGTRLQKPDVMEWQEIVITKEQNKEGDPFAPTMRSLFAGFYDEMPTSYDQALKAKKMFPTRFLEPEKGVFFDNNVYCKRIALSIDTLFLEANQRAKERNTTAFIHVVGIGLGVWKYSSHQDSLFLDICAKRIQALGKSLHSVSDVFFGYFSENATADGYKNNDVISIPEHPKNGIKIQIGKREPHVKLSGEDEGKLLVASYAWDGNALPGNEFWAGNLASSGDPAAACSTQVAELHNAHINPKVCGENLRIVTQNGVVTYREYCERVNKN